jgi:hypothetical protein
MLFHIADAPCHGREFHNSIMGDRFPNGDPSARTLLQLLGPLAENGVHYHFGKINELTDRMVQKFAEAYDGEFVVCDFKNPNRMVDNIVSTASIAVTRGNYYYYM